MIQLKLSIAWGCLKTSVEYRKKKEIQCRILLRLPSYKNGFKTMHYRFTDVPGGFEIINDFWHLRHISSTCSRKLLNSYIPCDILNIQFHFICIVLLGYFCKVTQDDTWHEDLIPTKEPASLLYTGTVCHPTAHLRTEQCTGCQRPHITWS